MQGAACRAQDLAFRVKGVRYNVLGSGHRAKSFGIRVLGVKCGI